jgi:hypothetical protein
VVIFKLRIMKTTRDQIKRVRWILKIGICLLDKCLFARTSRCEGAISWSKIKLSGEGHTRSLIVKPADVNVPELEKLECLIWLLSRNKFITNNSIKNVDGQGFELWLLHSHLPRKLCHFSTRYFGVLFLCCVGRHASHHAVFLFFKIRRLQLSCWGVWVRSFSTQIDNQEKMCK